LSHRHSREESNIETGPADFFALSFDGKFVALANKIDGKVRVWEVNSGLEVASFDYEGPADGIALSLDGTFMAISNGSDNVTRVWDVSSGNEVASLDGDHEALSFSPDGKYLAGAGRDAGVWEIVNEENGVSLHRIEDWELGCAHDFVAFSPDGKFLATYDSCLSSDDDGPGVRLWDVAGRKLVDTIAMDGVIDIAISKDARYIASVINDNYQGYIVQIMDVPSGEVKRFGNWPWLEPPPIAFSPDKPLLAAGGWLLALTGYTDAASINGDQVVSFGPGGELLITVEGSEEVEITSHTLNTNRSLEVTNQTYNHPTGSDTFSANRQYRAVAIEEDVVQVSEVLNPENFVKFEYEGQDIKVFALSPDGSLLAVASDGHVTVWKISTQEELASFAYDGEATHIALDTSVWYLVSSETTTGEGRRAGFDEWSTHLWEINSGQKRWSIDSTEPLPGLSLSPDGMYMTRIKESSDGRKELSIVETATGQELTTLSHRERDIEHFAFDKDGQHIATSSGMDGRLWEVASGRQIAQITYDRLFVDGDGIHISPNGKYLMTEIGNVVQLWHISPEDLIAEACARVTRNLTWEEWQQVMPDEPYRQTCEQWPVHPTAP
jgi:WD40 repeat protein